MHFDPSIYLVTDERLCLGRPLAEVVEAALAAGVTLLQYREKGLPDAEFVLRARRLLTLSRHYGVPLLLNDRANLVEEVGAEGAHVGQGDLEAGEARRLIGPNRILGVSVRNPDEARAAAAAGADYVAVNGVFITDTKTDLPAPLGLEVLTEIAGAVRLPVVAIGGINAENAAAVASAGAAGLAVVSAICSAPDVAAAVRRLAEQFRLGRRK